MGAIILPVMEAMVGYLLARRADVAKLTGLNEDSVAKVGNVLQDMLGQDDHGQRQVMAEIEKARQHDVATAGNAPSVVILLRGLVRPVVTLAAFAWYLTARIMGLPLSGEDYAIVGGIVAFWFGFRPFEKALNQQK
jgi:hypothetical protein